MKRKKALSLFLAAVMTAAACLGGCGSSAGTASEAVAAADTEAVETEAGSEQAAAEELEPVTIQLWLGGPGKQKDSDEVWELFNEKLQEYVPNTTVEITCMTTTEYPEKFDQMLASGEGVDLAWVASWVTGMISRMEI